MPAPSNLRQLAMATIMYANENKDALFSQQGNNLLTAGDFNTYKPNPSFAGFLNTQLGISSVCSPTTGTPDGDTLKNLTNNMPRVMMCPAAEYKQVSGLMRYGIWAGSLFPTAPSLKDSQYHGYKMRLTRLIEVGIAANLPGETPALWADKCVLAATNSNGGPQETNHWDRSTGDPAGGNVSRADGSVVWMPYYGAAYNSPNTANRYIIPGYNPSSARPATACTSLATVSRILT